MKKKKFSETGFGKFLKKASLVTTKNLPDIVEIGAMAVTNPIGAILKAKEMLLKSDENGTNALASELEEHSGAFMKEMELYYKDMNNARDMYKNTDHKLSNKIASRVIDFNLWVILASIIIEVLSVLFINDKILIAIISGAIGSITTALLQERQQIINFFFGSSMGSKEKDKK